MADVLDYSSGWPAPAAIKAARYVGVVRYVGTPGRGKNLTRAEAQQLQAADVAIALVYEDTAGWMQGGAAAGVKAARAALADAGACGVGVRCVYFAADFDVTSSAQMTTVERCLDGAAGVLGAARVGVYGEADVIDACLGTLHATYGWQTRAWSGGRVSGRAHLLQQIGYVFPGGVQADRSTVLRADWGQWPDPNPGGGQPATDETEDDMDEATYTRIVTTATRDAVASMHADLQNSLHALVTQRYDKGADTIREALDRLHDLPADLAAMRAEIAALRAELAGRVNAPGNE